MPRTVLASAGLFALALSACGPAEPYCGLPLDITMRQTVYCPDSNEDPVCDLPGDEARYEDTASGLRLTGGMPAVCDADDAVTCPGGTVGPPRCIRDPEL